MKPFFLPLVLILSLTGISATLLYVLLKKDDDEDVEPAVYTARQTVIEVRIPKDMVGVVIGREGANIKAIQQQSGARASFDKCGASDVDYRICKIYGTPDTAQKAETLIHEFLLNQPKTGTDVLTIQKKYCGQIIGRGGQNIRLIKNESHAKIIIEDLVDSDQSKVTIKGTTDQIAIARDLILKTIKELNTSQEELQDSIQNRSPRVLPKSHLNSVPKLPPIPDDGRSEILTPPSGGRSLDVFVSAMESPDQFWVQVINESGIKVDKLLDEMTSYYNNPENQELHKLSNFDEDQIVAAMFQIDKKWYRAEIVSVTETSEKQRVIEVFYVDYGDTAVVHETEVLELRTDFLTLRFQAIECFLAGVKPKNGVWSDEALDYFESLAHVAQWKKLSVIVKTYKERIKSPRKTFKRPLYGIELCDARENKWINMSDELLLAGFAERTDDLESSGMEDMYANQSTSYSQYRAVPELSDSGSDIDGFYFES